MSPENISIIWACADQEETSLCLGDIRECREPLEAKGLLREGAPESLAKCPSCGEGHWEEVDTVSFPDGEIAHYIHCPYGGGRVKIESASMRRWKIMHSRFASVLGELLQCEGGVREIVPDRLWCLGMAKVPLGKMRRQIWLVRKFSGSDSAQLREKLPASGKSPLLFVLGSMPAEPPRGFAGERVFALQELLSLGKDGFSFDFDAVNSRLQASRAGEEPRKQIPKRQSRATLIDSIKEHLRAHLRNARRYALNELDRNQQAKLLPRPTYEQLAEPLGVNKSSVMRAIQDRSDSEIMILWQTCDDIDRIVNYKK